MIFDQRPRELPVATLQSRDSRVRLAVGLRGWIAARWGWFRPRMVPVIVAFAGMLGVLASASYLRNLARETPEQLVVKRHEPPIATLPTIRLDVPVAAAPGGVPEVPTGHRCIDADSALGDR